MYKFYKTTIFLTAMLLITNHSAHANTRINGFANFVGGITSSDDTFEQYDDSLSFTNDSLFALQISSEVNSDFTATAQIIARGRNDYAADFEWAYVTYKINQTTDINLGRVRIPFFKYSSSVDIGYSYHWINPPATVYDDAFNNMDGVRVNFEDYFNGWNYKLQFLGGVIKGEFPNGEDEPVDYQLNDTLMAVVEVDKKWFSARAMITRAKGDFLLPINDLLDGISLVGNPSLADRIEAKDDTMIYGGLGMNVDFESWFAGLEYTYFEAENTYVSTQDTLLATAGYRVGSFTPHITHSFIKGDAKYLDEASMLPPPLNEFTSGLLFSQQLDVTEITAGIVYDFKPGLAFKLEFTSREDKTFPANDVDILKIAANYVF